MKKILFFLLLITAISYGQTGTFKTGKIQLNTPDRTIDTLTQVVVRDSITGITKIMSRKEFLKGIASSGTSQDNIVRVLEIEQSSLSGTGSIEQQICDFILSIPEEKRTIAENDSKWNIVLKNSPYTLTFDWRQKPNSFAIKMYIKSTRIGNLTVNDSVYNIPNTTDWVECEQFYSPNYPNHFTVYDFDRGLQLHLEPLVNLGAAYEVTEPISSDIFCVTFQEKTENADYSTFSVDRSFFALISGGQYPGTYTWLHAGQIYPAGMFNQGSTFSFDITDVYGFGEHPLSFTGNMVYGQNYCD